MAERGKGRFEQLLNRLAEDRWHRIASAAGDARLTDLRRQQTQARALRQHLDRFLHVADERLSMPRVGDTAFPRPNGTDWSWRPEMWRGGFRDKGAAAVENGDRFGQEVAVFHDCRISELALRQVRNLREADLAPYGLRLDVFRFDGSFLSVVLEMPPEAVQGLRKRHLVRLDAIIETEAPLELFARLNVQHGPNTEQVVREIPLAGGEVMVEFDLAYTRLNEKRTQKMWLDLIFEGPEMNQITIRDLTFCRYPRSEI